MGDKVINQHSILVSFVYLFTCFLFGVLTRIVMLRGVYVVFFCPHSIKFVYDSNIVKANKV